jgi:hydroxymethylpyrimidine pyrophosphatase-like HAD family hydrolase
MEHMAGYFRAVALDYDGTITNGPRPDAAMLTAVAHVRASSRCVVLVTGRILSELLHDFPDAYSHFDAIVAENGAVVWHAGRQRQLAPRVSVKLQTALTTRSIPVRRGSVILATDAGYDQQVREMCIELGLDDQLVRNRDALMVLPRGVSKASGLLEALAELGISAHSAIGIGDAENDLALLEACEIGVAAGNAVASLKEQADLVLEDIGPTAVVRFLEREVLRGVPGVQPRRRRVEVGVAENGARVSVPASRTQVFIDGPTGAGKSYVTGLLAEGLLRAGYALCVLDMEGDHANLGQLRGVLTLGGRDPLPTVDEVGRIVRHRFSSVVLDLSLREPALKYAYARDVLDRLTEVRREYGLPHWIVVEEAHMVSSESLERARAVGSLCLVTYHPEWLPAAAMREADILITVESSGRARIRTGADPAHAVCFAPGAREISHVRHKRKYAEGLVPYERGFTFRDAAGAIGTHVSSLAEFANELERVPRTALTHHAAHKDFSRWIRDVFQDSRLAAAVRRAEEDYRPEATGAFRAALEELLALRYETAAQTEQPG